MSLLRHALIALFLVGLPAVADSAPNPPGAPQLELPIACKPGQTCEVHGLLSMGCSVAINDDLGKLLTNLAEVKPTLLVAVPRIFNRIYDSVNRDLGRRPRRTCLPVLCLRVWGWLRRLRAALDAPGAAGGPLRAGGGRRPRRHPVRSIRSPRSPRCRPG